MGWLVLVIIVLLLIAVTIVLIVRAASKRRSGNTQNKQEQSNTYTFIPINDRRGKECENIVNHHLRILLKDDEYLLTNLLVPIGNGYKREIDSVLITRKGIFCIEIKNWVGHISGDNDSENWIQRYDDLNKKEQSHPNPVKQNEKNRDALERVLSSSFDYSIKNIVIFPEFEDRSNLYSSVTYSIHSFMKEYEKLSNEIYPDDLIDIYNELKNYQGSKEELEAHKKEVKKLHHIN